MTHRISARIITIASILGVAGLIPFFASAAASDLPWDYRDTALLVLLGYGACILSFVGAVHWGFVLSGHAEEKVEKPGIRLAFGTLPSLIAWVALILGFTGEPLAGIGVILAGLLATVLVEASWTRKLMVPLAYFRLRVLLSMLVALTLAAVLIARILGISL